MLLTISTTYEPATDLGYLLHKNPATVLKHDLTYGTAFCFFPEATDQRTTVALFVEMEPRDLLKGRNAKALADGDLGRYINDRPYAASSHLASALNHVFRTALSGVSRERPELVELEIPLTVRIPVLPVRGGPALLRRLFAPLGYDVQYNEIALDENFPEWGASRYVEATFTITARLQSVLQHFLVLIPVLDDAKHYWINSDEVDRLILRGGTWLTEHPERELITRRYLQNHRELVTDALDRLVDVDFDSAMVEGDSREEALEKGLSLNQTRLETVLSIVQSFDPTSVLDLGCGSGQLMARLLKDTNASRVVGVDVSHRVLESAAKRLNFDTMTPRQRDRVELLHGSLIYRDRRLEGFDVAAVVEVIEHLEPTRLASLELAVFGRAQPRAVIVTTPNAEFNVNFPNLANGTMRHPDHRFEWTRLEFDQWANSVAQRFDYSVAFYPIGPVDDDVGPPTQMAVFRR